MPEASRRTSTELALVRFWFDRSGKASTELPKLAIPLLGVLSFFFGLALAVRKCCYRLGLFKSHRLTRPTLVVGSIVVGGSGKTPVVIALAQALLRSGYKPGIISRGYLAGSKDAVQPVQSDSSAEASGDEPLLIALKTGCPVWIGRDRVATGRALLAAHPECDVILSDDGLQHYRLERDIEIAVFDSRGTGNGRLLPRGPLREPVKRLGNVDLLLLNGVRDIPAWAETAAPGINKRLAQLEPIAFELRPGLFYRLDNRNDQRHAEDFAGKQLYAVAGIAHPERFFATLAELGLNPHCRAFGDHHRYQAADLDFARDGIVLMTEKDAVKCAPLQKHGIPEAWVLPVDADLSDRLIGRIVEILDGCKTARHSGMPDLQGQPRL